MTSPFKISPAEYEIILAFRELGIREKMVVTKLEGKLEAMIDIQRRVLVGKSNVTYTTEVI